MPARTTYTKSSDETRTDVAARGRLSGLAGGVGVVALGALAAGQLANMAYGRVEMDPAEPWITESHDLADLEVRLEDGTVARLSAVGPTLLLVFDVECSHSQRIAPLWAAWLSRNRTAETTVLAVTASHLAVAVRYARARQWSVELATVDSTGDGSLGRAVTRRTPWVFAIDHDGRVIAHAHGTRIQEVARVLDEHMGGTRNSETNSITRRVPHLTRSIQHPWGVAMKSVGLPAPLPSAVEGSQRPPSS